MNFEGDAFISYAHLDNVELASGHGGWVAKLHLALETRLAMLLGKKSRIWRDPELQGNDDISDTLLEKVRSVAALVPVISPRYVKSEWSLRELAEFCSACELQGGVQIGDKARIFKVMKTPVPREQHPQGLQDLLGYEFFKLDPETGRIRELDEIFGPEAKTQFWLKLDDLANDLCGLLQLLESQPEAADSSGAPYRVFLAETTNDLRDQRQAIKRDLMQHGYTVLPTRALPLSANELTAAIWEDLDRCRMSIHMIGRNYSFVPEGGHESLLEIQHELAITRGKTGPFSRLIWIPPGLQVNDLRQQKVIKDLRMDQRINENADLLETPLEDFRTVIDAWLKRDRKPRPVAPSTQLPPSSSPPVYVIYDQRDAGAISPWCDLLFTDFEVIHPVFTGTEAEIREYHEENLRSCAGVLIFYGSSNEAWLRRKLGEIQKSVGYGRTKALPVTGIVLIPPKTAEKERFRTHKAIVMPQWEGASLDLLQPFISAAKASVEASQDDPGGRAA
jgi:hypothetical protein